jgi:hypothetical protein
MRSAKVQPAARIETVTSRRDPTIATLIGSAGIPSTV